MSKCILSLSPSNGKSYNYFEIIQRRGLNDEIIHVGMNTTTSYTLNAFRECLWENYGVPKDSRICYIDDDKDILPIDSQCEFIEALKFLRTCQPLQLTKKVPLLVDYITCNKLKANDAMDRGENSKNNNFPTLSFLNNMQQDEKSVLDLDKQKCENCKTSSWMQRFSDTSPPPWFTDYMESMKRDIVSTITCEVVKSVTEILDKRLNSTPSIAKETSQSESQSHFWLPKRHIYPSDLHSNEKNQKRKRIQNEVHSRKLKNVLKLVDMLQSNTTSFKQEEKEQDMNTKDYTKRKQQKKLNYDLERIEDKMRVILDEKQCHCIAEVSNNSDKDTSKEQPIQDNAQEDFTSQRSLSPPINQNLYDDRIQSEMSKVLDNELRMNCSIIGHQMLDINRRKDPWCCSICSVVDDNNRTNDQEEDNFEMIDMPLEDATQLEDHIEKQTNSSRGSPSFEVVSETPSPRSSMYIDEDHFSINEGDLQQSDGTNLPKNISHVEEIHGKVYNKDPPTDFDQHMNIHNCVEHSDGAYPSIVEILTDMQDTCPSDLIHVEHQSNQPESSHDDVKSSHISYSTNQNDSNETRHPEEPSSYPKVFSQCDCESQTDSGDFTQSFDSHIISINDDHYAKAYVNTKLTVEQQKTASPRNNFDDWEKKAKEEPEERHEDMEKCICQHQLSRGSGSERSSNGSKKSTGENVSNTTDPLHILPETFVTAAAHVGSIAYGTAREVLDKIRAHTREDIRRPRPSRSFP